MSVETPELRAEKYNAENALFIRYKPLAQKYHDNWMVHKAHSVLPSEVDAGLKTNGYHRGHTHTESVSPDDGTQE